MFSKLIFVILWFFNASMLIREGFGVTTYQYWFSMICMIGVYAAGIFYEE